MWITKNRKKTVEAKDSNFKIVRMKKLLPCSTQYVKTPERSFGNIQSFPHARSRILGNNQIKTRTDVWKIVKPFFSRQKPFQRYCEMNVIVRCHPIQKRHFGQRNQHCGSTFSLDYISWVWRRPRWKSGIPYWKHQLRWQRLPRISLTKNCSSSHKEVAMSRLMNKPKKKTKLSLKKGAETVENEEQFSMKTSLG